MIDLIDAAHLFIIPLQSNIATSYFNMYCPSIREYESEEILKIHLTAEELPQDPPAEEYSECETHMTDCQVQIILPATAARGLIFVSAVIFYKFAHDAIYVTD